MRRKALASILAVAALSISAAPAFADPDFGPGNSSKGPNDGGAKCHPDGEVIDPDRLVMSTTPSLLERF